MGFRMQAMPIRTRPVRRRTKSPSAESSPRGTMPGRAGSKRLIASSTPSVYWLRVECIMPLIRPSRCGPNYRGWALRSLRDLVPPYDNGPSGHFVLLPLWQTLRRSGTLISGFTVSLRGTGHDHRQAEYGDASAVCWWICVGAVKRGAGRPGWAAASRLSSGRPAGSRGPLWRARQRQRLRRPRRRCARQRRGCGRSALLVLSVTDPKNFCFGGEVPILVYDAAERWSR